MIQGGVVEGQGCNTNVSSTFPFRGFIGGFYPLILSVFVYVLWGCKVEAQHMESNIYDGGYIWMRGRRRLVRGR